MSKAAEVLDSFKYSIILAYHQLPDPKPLDEFCALLVQSCDEDITALVICRVDDIEGCVSVAGPWPEFVEYAKHRMAVQPATGMLRVVMATRFGMAAGRVQVLPGAQA